MAQLAEHLVGRAEELGTLDAALAEAERGRSHAIELVGEPGTGKTRLLSELAGRAARRGQLVLAGRASELERDLPFWVFVDALDEYVAGFEPRGLRRLDDEVLAELGHVLPSLSVPARTALQDERYRTHRAVRELLELLAATKPLVLVLDDLHWADSGSVELLGALLRRPPAAGVLFALAVRPRQLPERLSAALERAHREGTLARVQLGALTLEEAREFLGDAVDRGVAGALHAESGGNPFYLEQLARSLQRVVPTARAGPDVLLGDVEVPSAVAAALGEELALLSPRARRVLEGAAVAGDPFEIELAAAAAPVPEASAVPALDELLRCDLVRGTDVPRRFRFWHPLVRRAVYEATPGGWRLGAHERCAAALAARGASAVSRAHHVERSARDGDMGAVALLREAGGAVAHRAPPSAARWFGGALRLLPETAPAHERVELLLARAGALAATGQFAESHAALLECLLLVPDEAVALRVRLTATCAGIEQLRGHHEQAHARLAGALDSLDDHGSREAVVLMIELATVAFYRVEYEPMGAWATRALNAARPLGERPLTAAAMAALTLACASAGAIAEAEARRTEAAALVDALPDDELAVRLDAAVHLATAEVYMEHYEEARIRCERAIAVARTTGQRELFPILVVLLGAVTLMQGRPAAASELLEGAVEAARLSGNDQVLALNLLNRAHAVLAQGDVETALVLAEESVELARGLDDSLLGHWGAEALAAVLLQAGDPARAVTELVGSAGGEELSSIPGGLRVSALELLTRCLLAIGRDGDARRAAASAQTAAAAVGLRLAGAMAHLAAAAVALDAADAASAADRALAAAAGCDDVGVPIEAARSRTLAGRALALDGQRERAIAQLERAAAELERCGALRLRDETERELRRLGRRIHRRSRPGKTHGIGVESLTERELQIARLVVDRKTNPEIAAELFLSHKTVESHLRNAFAKLAVSSRVQLARAVERADRAQPEREVGPAVAQDSRPG